MDVSALEPNTDHQTDQYPLLLDQMERHTSHEHIVDISSNDEASTSSTPPLVGPGSTSGPTYQTAPPTGSNGRNSSRRADGYARGRRRSPLNSGLWITVELIVTVSQVIASVVVLSLSRDENPQAPLFAWIVGYASGCVAMLPILYWRYRNRNRSVSGRLDSAIRGSSSSSSQQISNSNPPEARPYTAIAGSQALDEESNQNSETATWNSRSARFLSTRLNGLVDHFKMALDCFFAVWFVVGNVWIFGGHTSPSDAPKLYRLCIVFLTFSCIGYAMPFILCATICCCLPCIISVLGIREDFSQNRGATVDLINSLPTYKFKLKKTRDGSNNNNNNQELESGVGEGGILAAGTEKEREISGEDAVCCICLARYGDNDELRELPCTHVFHVECVDKWLQINASCPLCKAELGESDSSSPVARDSTQ